MNLNIFITHITKDVNIVHARNHIHLKIKPKTPPSNDIPLSAPSEESNIIPHGAAESPNVHIAIRLFLRFSFHSCTLDIF